MFILFVISSRRLQEPCTSHSKWAPRFHSDEELESNEHLIIPPPISVAPNISEWVAQGRLIKICYAISILIRFTHL